MTSPASRLKPPLERSLSRCRVQVGPAGRLGHAGFLGNAFGIQHELECDASFDCKAPGESGIDGGDPLEDAGRSVVRLGLILRLRLRDRRWRCPGKGPP